MKDSNFSKAAGIGLKADHQEWWGWSPEVKMMNASCLEDRERRSIVFCQESIQDAGIAIRRPREYISILWGATMDSCG